MSIKFTVNNFKLIIQRMNFCDVIRTMCINIPSALRTWAVFSDTSDNGMGGGSGIYPSGNYKTKHIMETDLTKASSY